MKEKEGGCSPDFGLRKGAFYGDLGVISNCTVKIKGIGDYGAILLGNIKDPGEVYGRGSEVDFAP